MTVPFLDLSRLHQPIKDELIEAVDEILKTNQYIRGPACQGFEENFARKTQTRHAIGVNSGTDALLLTLHALGVGPEDEVICPAFTFAASADVIPRVGAQVVFCDVGADFNLDVEAVRASITERTRAIMCVHLFGQAANLAELSQICAERGIHLIEDCAQATGAAIEGKPVGSFGVAGCFSFYPTKNLGGFGDGGMVTTDNDELAARIKLYRDHGRDDKGNFLEIGYNSRLDDLQAALLNVKLQTLDEDNADRIANATFYHSTLNPEVFSVPPLAPDGTHVYNLFTIRHPQRDMLRNFLKERGIGTAVYYSRPLHLEPCFEYLGYVEGHFPMSEQLSGEVLSLPVAPGLTRKELDEVAHALDLFAQTYSTAAS